MKLTAAVADVDGEAEGDVGTGETVLMGVGEGEDLGEVEGLNPFLVTKNETTMITTNKTATKTKILCCFKTCMLDYLDKKKLSVFMPVAPSASTLLCQPSERMRHYSTSTWH